MLDRNFMINFNDKKFSGRTDYLNRTYEKRMKDVIEDPFFSSFSLVIDENYSPLFKLLRNYGDYEHVDLASEIEIALTAMHDTNGIENQGYLMTVAAADFANGVKLGNGLQKSLNIDNPIYGATEYIYMVDAVAQPDFNDSNSEIANLTANVSVSGGADRTKDNYEALYERYLQSNAVEKKDRLTELRNRYGENSVEYKNAADVEDDNYVNDVINELKNNQIQLDSVESELAKLNAQLAAKEAEMSSISGYSKTISDNISVCNESINACKNDIEKLNKQYKKEQTGFSDKTTKIQEKIDEYNALYETIKNVYNNKESENHIYPYLEYPEGVLTDFKIFISDDKDNLDNPNNIIPIGADGMTYKYELGSSVLPSGLEEDINKDTSQILEKEGNETTTKGKGDYINKCREMLSIIGIVVSKESDTTKGEEILKNILNKEQELIYYTNQKEYYQEMQGEYTSSLQDNIDKIKKDIEAYETVKNELENNAESINNGDSTSDDDILIKDGRNYSFGDTGDEVKKIQEILSIPMDGLFGKNTEEAVKVFQEENGISNTGIVDDITRKKLNDAITARNTSNTVDDKYNSESAKSIDSGVAEAEREAADAVSDAENGDDEILIESRDKTRVDITVYPQDVFEEEEKETPVTPIENGIKRVVPKCPRTVIDMLDFRNGILSLTKKYPYILQSITGLDEAYKNNYIIKDPYHGSGDGKISITCYEAVDLRVSSMFNKYFNAAYDKQYRRERLPVNMRRFHCSVYVHDIRDFVLGNKVLYNLYPTNKNIVDTALNSLSSVEFRFYDCEIVPDETGNIFDSISNAELGDMKTTTFTFTYGNCIINFLSYADMCKVFSSIRNSDKTPVQDPGEPSADNLNARKSEIIGNRAHSNGGTPSFVPVSESEISSRTFEQEKLAVNSGKALINGETNSLSFAKETDAIRGENPVIKDINGYTPLNWLNASVGFNELGYEYMGNVNDDDFWEATDWYNMSSVQRRYSMRDTDNSAKDAIDLAMRNHISNAVKESDPLSNLGSIDMSDKQTDAPVNMGDVIPDDVAGDDVIGLGNIGTTVEGVDLDNLGSIDMSDNQTDAPTNMGDVIPDDVAGDVANDLGNLGVVVNGTDIYRLGSVDMKDKPVAGPTDMGDVIPDDIAGDAVNELGQIDLNEKSGKVASSLGNMNNSEEKGENVKSLGSLDLNDVDVADIQSLMKI